MHRKSVRGVFLALSAVLAASAFAQTPPRGEGEARALVLRAMETDRLPSLSVAVGREGRILFSFAAGLADLENGVAASPASLYRIGSVTKSLTAAAALGLSEDGRFDLDAPVERACPAFPGKPFPVTPRLLLAHMGGIRAYDRARFQEEFFGTKRWASPSEAVSIFAGDPLAFSPGTRYGYTSWGYVLLGCALEGAGKARYRELLARLVLEKAGMTSTRLDVPEELVERRARGYSRAGETAFKNARFVDLSDREPAGGLISTPTDLVRFGTSLLAGRVLARASVEAAFTPQRLASGEEVPSGLGWSLSSEGEAFQGGSSVGFSAYLYLDRRTGIVVALATNVDLWTEPRHALARALARALAP